MPFPRKSDLILHKEVENSLQTENMSLLQFLGTPQAPRREVLLRYVRA